MFNLPVPRRFITILIVLSFSLAWLAGPASARSQSVPPVDKPLPGVDPLPALEPVQSPGSEGALLQDEQAAPGAAPWSFLAFESFRDGNWEIYLTTNQQPAPLRLTNDGAIDQSPRVNPQGTHVAFVSDRDGNDEIYTVGVDGSGLKRMTNTREGRELQPAWSPDGTKLALAGRARNSDFWEIYTLLADGQGREISIAAGSKMHNLYPAWSPDGTKLAWVRIDAYGYGRLCLANPDGSQLRYISPALRFLSSPAWSPDGQKLAFDADMDQDGWNELGVIQADGTGLKLLYDFNISAVDAVMGAWSKGDEELLFSRLDYTWYWDQYYLNAADVYRLDLVRNRAVPWTGDGVSMAPDYVSADRSAPTVALTGLPEYSRAGGFKVTWSVYDTGGSGVGEQHLQKRVLPSAQWIDVFKGLSDVYTWELNGEPGEVHEFRLRVRDEAYNYSEWTEIVRTTLYAWDLGGRARDTREHTLPGVNLQINPTPMAPAITNLAGRYHARLQASGTYALQASQPGYTPLPASGIAISADRDYDTWLLPDDDLIENGGFEASDGLLAGWTGSPGAALNISQRDTGPHQALLGRVCPELPCLSSAAFVPAIDAKTFSLAVDHRGRLHLILSRSSATGIFYMVRSEEGSWSAPALVPGTELFGSGYSTTDLASDTAGNLYAVWGGLIFGSYSIYYSQFTTATGAWSTPVNLAAGTLPVIAVGQDGSVHVGYHGNPKYTYLERLPSGEWLPPVSLGQCNPNCFDLAVGPDNRVHFVWYEPETGRTIYQVHQPDGAWETPESIYLNDSSVSLLVDSQNTVHLFTPGQYRYKLFQGTWSAIEMPGMIIASRARVLPAMDSQGSIFILYPNRLSQTVYYKLQVRRAGVWSEPVELPAQISESFAIAAGPDDQIHILDGMVDSAGWGFRYYSAQIPAAGQEWLSQALQIPAEMHKPTLSFWYLLSEGSENPATDLSVQMVTASESTEVFNARQTTPKTVSSGWQHAWVDLSEWAGQAVTVTFTLQQAAGELYRAAGLDDVSLGSWLTSVIHQGAPAVIADSWTGRVITITGANFIPGATVHIGDVPAESVEWLDESTLQATVPPGLAQGFYNLWVFNPGGQPGALAGGLRLGYHLFLPFVRR